jgi:hypothetical protein
METGGHFTFGKLEQRLQGHVDVIKDEWILGQILTT